MEQDRRDFLKSAGMATVSFGLIQLFSIDNAFADKSSVSIEAPERVAKGSEVTIKINVSHNANNFLHYTRWLSVKVNGEEIARWDYTWRKRPAGKIFTKQIIYTVKKNIEVIAEANCNIHGSKGAVTFKINIAA